MGHKQLAWVLLLLAPIATAQVSTDEAAARLKAREAARASSQPSDELQVLRQAIKSLQAQVAALKDENLSLRRQLVDAKKRIPPPAPKKTDDLPGILNPTVKIKVGMTLDEAIATLGPTDRVVENGDGSKMVYWRTRVLSGVGGGFSGVSTDNSSSTGREVTADVDPKGIIKDFTDSK